jgi:hypothetical protein
MNADGFYVLELFSGHGDVARIWSRIFNCEHVTVDLDVKRWKPSFPASLPGDIPRLVKHVRDRFKGRKGLLWAGVPCNNYSRLNTRGVRDLEYADSLVAAVKEIAKLLDIVHVVIENPGTGLLVGRDAIAYMPHRVEVDYCAYGKGYRKRTSLWSTVDLRAHGFKELKCCDACQALTIGDSGRMVHRESLDKLTYEERVSYPGNLVNAVGMAIWKAIVAEAVCGFVPDRKAPEGPIDMTLDSDSEDSVKGDDSVIVIDDSDVDEEPVYAMVASDSDSDDDPDASGITKCCSDSDSDDTTLDPDFDWRNELPDPR